MPDLLEPGNLLRIKDFEFEDGSTRDKYVFVLCRNESEACVVFTLTTSKNKMNLGATKRGCYSDRRIFQYFHFPANEPLDADGFFFDVDTYVFFNQNIRRIQSDRLLQYQNPADPLALLRMATLPTDDLKKLLNCVLLSPFVPGNLKTELAIFRDSL